MSTLSIRLPDSVHEKVKTLARQDGVSINQFISSAVAEKMSAVVTENYLRKRAQQANEQAFRDVLAKVPDTEPAADDSWQ